MTETALFSHAGSTLVAETWSPAEWDSSVGAGGTSPAPTYVMIHGIGMGRTIFTGLIDELGDSRFTAVAIDLPGYGEAPEPPRTLTMERTADLVAAFILDRGLPPVVLVGHSMGTQVAVEVAARHAELVDRVVLIAPTVNPRERTVPRQVLRLAQDLVVESPRIIFIGAREYLRAGPKLRGKFRAMLAHRPEDTYPRVRVPALVLRGEKDVVCSRSWCRFVAGSLPHGRLAEIEGHGHETMIRDAARAAAEIRAFADHD